MACALVLSFLSDLSFSSPAFLRSSISFLLNPNDGPNVSIAILTILSSAIKAPKKGRDEVVATIKPERIFILGVANPGLRLNNLFPAFIPVTKLPAALTDLIAI